VRVTIEELAALVDGERADGDADTDADTDTLVTSFAVDSRTVAPGACFFALVGERDGHDYVTDALSRGAVAAVVSRVPNETRKRARSAVLVRVADPLVALAKLGAIARDRSRATVVGITGSVGKTATKDLTAAAMGEVARVHASPASFNNEVGLPLTLLSALPETEIVVAEMGARRVGDLTALCRIARPSVGAITNIGMAHAALFGRPEEVAKAKGELLEALPASGIAVLNADDPTSPALAARTSARVLTVGTARSDVVYHSVRVDDQLRVHLHLDTPWGSSPVALSLRGEHQAPNAAMAATISLALEAPLGAVVEGLATARAASRRMELHRSRSGVWVLDDSYNANPASVEGALRALARLPAKRKIAVLGEMLELGAESHTAHVGLGRLADEVGLDVMVVVGEGARPILDGLGESGEPIEVIEVADPDDAADVVARVATSGDAVLVKASRAVGLERVVVVLLEDAA